MVQERIYVADDEENIREIIGSFLKNEGYEVSLFATGDELLETFLKVPAHMIILDIMMPGTDGLTLCNTIREKYHVPIILVSAKDSELDRITGITMGGDDYLVKPFSPIELVARVKALFRRINLDRGTTNQSVLRYGDLDINIDTRRCTHKGAAMELTPTEFALMSYMIEHSDRAISREELLKNVWKFDFDVDTRATDDVLKRLRKKLLPTNVRVQSVWGFGFKLALEEAP